MASIPDPKELEGRKKGQTPAPQSRDFFWDSITLYIVAVILALTAIDVVTEFVRGSELHCYLPNNTDSSLLASVQDYVNAFCSSRLPSLQYLPAFIAVHAIAILAPHYVWLNAYGADLDFFFKHVSQIGRTRTQTGDYPSINHSVSKQLEDAFSTFSRWNGMYVCYLVKLIGQMMLCVLGIIVVPVWLFKENKQHMVFECPENEGDARGDSWPLLDYETVVCVFSPLSLLQKIWVVYQFLLALAAFFLLINFLLLIKWHTAELGFEKCAEFSFQTGLTHHYYNPQILNTVHFIWDFSIHSDYDFMMVKLFRTDGGLAYIMKEVHILRILQYKNRIDLAKLNVPDIGK